MTSHKAAVDHLDRLVALGLVDGVAIDSGSAPRFSMLPTIRAFAAGRAGEAESAAASARHAEYFSEWVAGLNVGEPVTAALLNTERDNLRAALDWFRGHDPQSGLAMAISMYRYWRGQGRENEGLAAIESLLASVDDGEAFPKAQQQAAMLAHQAGRFELADRLAARSLAAYRSVDDPRGSAEALATMGTTALISDPKAAVEHCRAAVTQAEPLGDASLLSWCWERLAVALEQLGRLDEATTAVRRAVEVAAEHGLVHQQVLAIVDLADILLVQDAAAAADQVLSTAEPLLAAVDDVVPQAYWLATRGVARAHLGDLSGASICATSVDERAVATGSPLIRDWADWVLGEVTLAEGDHEEAAAIRRRGMSNEPPQGYPLNRITGLAGLAVAAADIDTAALAVAAARVIADRYVMNIPAAPTRRLDAVQARWIDAMGVNAWSDRVAAGSARTLEDLVHDLTGAR